MKKSNRCEPSNPQHNFVQILNINDAKDEDELVEDKIPKFIFHMLRTKLLLSN